MSPTCCTLKPTLFSIAVLCLPTFSEYFLFDFQTTERERTKLQMFVHLIVFKVSEIIRVLVFVIFDSKKQTEVKCFFNC